MGTIDGGWVGAKTFGFSIGEGWVEEGGNTTLQYLQYFFYVTLGS